MVHLPSLSKNPRLPTLGGQVGEFTPLDLFGGGLYTGRLYDMQQSLMWTDDGITPATAGQSVERIEDLTGAYDARQTDSAFKAVLQEDGTLACDGVDDFYRTTLTAGGYGPQTYCFAGTISSTNGLVLAGKSLNYARSGIGIQSSLARGHFGWETKSGGSSIRNVPVLLAMTYLGNSSSTEMKIYVNGTLVGTFSAAGQGNTNGMFLFAEAEASTPKQFVQANARGVLAINRILAAAEMAALQAYWGI